MDEERNEKREVTPEAGVKPKSVWRPIIAAVLSLVFAGLGHLYLREYVRGALFLFIALFLYSISDYSARAFILNIALFIFSAFDAYSFGKRGEGII